MPYLAQAHHLRPKVDAKQYLKCRGQLAVSIAELTPQAVANSDPKSMDEFGKLFLKGHQTPIEIFRLEVTMLQLLLPCHVLPCYDCMLHDFTLAP